MYEERRWGIYRVLDDTPSMQTVATASQRASHSKKRRTSAIRSTNIVQKSICSWRAKVSIFVLDGVEKRVKASDTVFILVEHYHAIKALTLRTFIEVQSGNSLVVENIERFEYNWKA